jgi:antitoxin component YwqK of YwqJK toxin-antitoxin module
MKKLIAFAFMLFLISSVGFGQTESKPKYAPRKDKHRNVRDELDRKQGLWKHYDYSGTLIWEVEYLNDQKNGISRRYYPNGRVMRETEYSFGIKDGTFKRFGYDGLLTEGEYSEGKKANQWTNYFSDGQIKSTGLYKAGHKNGEWKYYNRKGAQVNSIVYKNGVDVQELLAAEKRAADLKKATEVKKNRSKQIVAQSQK